MVMMRFAGLALDHDLAWRVRALAVPDRGVGAAMLGVDVAVMGGVAALGFSACVARAAADGAAHDVPIADRAGDFGGGFFDYNFAALNYLSTVCRWWWRGFDHVSRAFCRRVSGEASFESPC